MAGTYTLIVGAERNIEIDYSDALSEGELLTEDAEFSITASPAGMTISNEAVNTSALTIYSKTVDIGKAVTFSAEVTTAATYTITVDVRTNATNPQKFRDRYQLTFTA